MDIQKEKLDYTAMLVAEDAITQDQCDTLKLSDGMHMFYSYQLSSAIIDCINWGWSAWLKAKAVPEILENDCMIEQYYFPAGTPVANLIKHAEEIYKSVAAAQNSKIEFGTDDNVHWFAHDVPFYGRVQISHYKEDCEWDIYFNECWQGPFNSKAECIRHLEECIAEQRKAQELTNN